MFRQQRKSSGMKWGLIGGLVAGGATLIPLVPVIRRRAMNITPILKKDHRMVSGLILTLELTPKINGMARHALFDQIRHQVLIHAQSEEEVLYPAMRHVFLGEEESKVSEAYREHQLVKDLLDDMRNIDPMNETFDSKVAELKKNFQHHVEEEEGEMFDILRRRMSDEQMRDLGRGSMIGRSC